MFYYLFEYLDKAYHFPGAGVFQYLSFRAALAVVTSLVISMLFGKSLIRYLLRKQVGETVRDLGLEGQKQKEGTPTMGGLIILGSILIPTLLFAKLDNIYIILMLVSTVWLGLIGFIDDYIKVFRKDKKGLAGKFKIAGQIVLGLVIGLTIYFEDTIVIREKITSEEISIENTITKTEKPEIDVEVKVAKGYNAAAKDYEIELKVKVSELLDDIKAYYENASVSGVLDKWKRNRLEYTSSFLTGREIGEQKIRLEVEKDGARAEKEFSINIALSENEIASSSLNRNDLKLLWKDLLKDTELQLDREELFRKEYELVEKVGLKNVEKTASLFLKQLSNYLLSNQKSYEDISNGFSVILSLLPSKPWIYNGNRVEEVTKAEFPISGEASYLLAKFLSEMDIGEEYVYAARAMVDQMLTIANWLKIDPFKVLEYEGKKNYSFGI